MAVNLTNERQMLCMEVAWEIDALARKLPDLVPLVADDGGAHFLVRAIAGRLLRLTSVLMEVGSEKGAISNDSMHVFNFEEGQG